MAARADRRTHWYLGSGGRANTLAGDGRSRRPRRAATASDATLRSRRSGADDRRGQLGADDDQGAETPVLPGPRDQRVLERRDDVLCYTSEPLERI